MNVGMTYTTIRTSRKKTNEAKIHTKKKKKTTFQDQLTTKDQSHSPPTAKTQLRNENCATSPTSRTGCRRIQVKSMK